MNEILRNPWVRLIAAIAGIVLLLRGLGALRDVLTPFVLSPRQVGHRIGLHPVVVILAVLVGGTAFGFFGMLLAVPATAALSVFWGDLRDAYLASAFYRGTA